MQLPGRTELLLRMRQEKEEMEALRRDPLQFDPDAEARKRLAETKAALSGLQPRPAAAPAAGAGAAGGAESIQQVCFCTGDHASSHLETCMQLVCAETSV
eukprot:scaffold61839_cov20-Tisochrysis_lutea.AAC.3